LSETLAEAECMFVLTCQLIEVQWCWYNVQYQLMAIICGKNVVILHFSWCHSVRQSWI